MTQKQLYRLYSQKLCVVSVKDLLSAQHIDTWLHSQSGLVLSLVFLRPSPTVFKRRRCMAKRDGPSASLFSFRKSYLFRGWTPKDRKLTSPERHGRPRRRRCPSHRPAAILSSRMWDISEAWNGDVGEVSDYLVNSHLFALIVHPGTG